MDYGTSKEYIDGQFESTVYQNLHEFSKIPNSTPSIDPEWNTNGYQEDAAIFLLKWVQNQNLKNLNVQIYQKEERTPLILVEIEGEIKNKTIFFYGHLDKQLHLSEWPEIFTKSVRPIFKGDFLLGRGVADNGHSIFSSILAVKAIQEQGLEHCRILITIEGSEESGSQDLLYYINKLKNKIGKVDLIVFMDSGCLSYDRLWITTSLRGLLLFDVTIQTMDKETFTGKSSGLVSDPFMILRNLMNRIEDSKNGEMIEDFKVQIPEERLEDIRKIENFVKYSDTDIFSYVKMKEGVKTLHSSTCDSILNNTWKPSITLVGLSGLYPHEGNIIRKELTARLSIRIPPTLEPEDASASFVKQFAENVPFNSNVKIDRIYAGHGWNKKEFSAKLKQILLETSEKIWDQPYLQYGEGISNSFIHTFTNIYSEAECIMIGVIGPDSFVRSIDEGLHLPYVKKLTNLCSHLVYKYSQD